MSKTAKASSGSAAHSTPSSLQQEQCLKGSSLSSPVRCRMLLLKFPVTVLSAAARSPSPYYLQTYLSERANRNLKEMIASFVGDTVTHWDRNISEFQFAITSTIYEVTGLAPAELNLARALARSVQRILQSHWLGDVQTTTNRSTPNYESTES